MIFFAVLASWCAMVVGTVVMWSAMRMHQRGAVAAPRATAAGVLGAAILASGAYALAWAIGA